MYSPLHKISLITFDTCPRKIFPFTSVTGEHLKLLEPLEAKGVETALYDAIIYSLKQFPQDSALRSLTILTDGGDTLSNPTNRTTVTQMNEDFIIKKTRELTIKGCFLHIGDRQIENTKRLSERLKHYDFYQFNQGNQREFTQTYFQTIAAAPTSTTAENELDELRMRHIISQSPDPPQRQIPTEERWQRQMEFAS
ncbi:unnamed protein product [Didymodactylos carnosus]|uniref:VWFA domain-containing protein n=1 Tax=Didymodactylos carnosus TaxID=1234261 RepID=A0A8S2IVN7_9BILA|nr:unnamed protein product [Didymodactylos carnosus]CAF3761953.1 unnamed protein product [Didymodactylos carnosus]